MLKPGMEVKATALVVQAACKKGVQKRDSYEKKKTFSREKKP